MMTAFNLGTKSNNVRNAWRILNYAIIKFNHNLIQTNEVIGVYEEGESLIGGVTYTTSGITHEEPAPKIQKQKQNDENKEEREPNLQKNGDGEKS